MRPKLKQAGAAVCMAGLGIWAARALLRRARWFDFAGRRVLVTGGSRGLGLVIARRLAAAGARVAICARTESQVAAAGDELRQAGADVLAYVCDVTDRRQVEWMVAEIERRWGGLDVLFNVAGVIEVGPFDAMTRHDFHRAMETHCWAPLNTTLAALPGMRRRRWGRIVNIASLGGKRAVPQMLPYAASKFALVGLSTGLRTELAQDGILVTTVSPGLMRTGSPRNATFKGQHRKEYAWFSIFDALPLVSMNADRAAAKILLATQRGDAELVLTGLGNVAVALQTAAPNLTAEIAALAHRLLPAMGGIGQAAAKGHESTSLASPSLLTRLGDRAAIANNETISAS